MTIQDARTTCTEDSLAHLAAQEYDQINEQYRESKKLPFRTFVESPSLFERIGANLSGLNVIDLACGEGHYTRKIKGRGANEVLGVDISPEMIHLAEKEEARHPQGIRYQCADVRDLPARPDLQGHFHICSAAFLLNYAASYEHLLAMLRGIYHVLDEGGRFVSVNDSFLQDPSTYQDSRPYGFIKQVESEGERVNGQPITYTFWDPATGEPFSFHNYYLSVETYQRAFREAGFKSFQVSLPHVAPEGVERFGAEYWGMFLSERTGPILMLEAEK